MVRCVSLIDQGGEVVAGERSLPSIIKQFCSLVVCELIVEYYPYWRFDYWEITDMDRE